MIHWVKPVIPRKYVLLALLLVLFGFFLVQSTTTNVKHSYYEEQVEAARLMAEASGVIKNARLELGIQINRELDPNETGLIGETLTTITSSVGNIEAKRTSTNPDFAALMVQLFHQAGLEAGDVVAIGASGSFPGLIVATLAACQVMELRPLLIYSVGASMYGANIPEFTFIEMLEALHKHNLLPYEILAVSLGGDNDRGEGMLFSESQEVMLNIANSANATFIFAQNNEASIQERLLLYLENNHGRSPDCFVNIGGASPNHGNTNASLKFPNGLVTYLPIETKSPERGLIFEYLEQGIPVIHLLNIRDLALKSGIAIDPIPFSPIGSEGVYFEVRQNKWLIWGTVFLSLSVLVLGLMKD